MIDIVPMTQCSSISNFQLEIPSSDGKSNYIVTHGPTPGGPYQYGFECTCKGFQFRGTCRHLKEAEPKFCGWHEQFDDGSPVEGKCPRCGEKVEGILVGV